MAEDRDAVPGDVDVALEGADPDGEGVAERRQGVLGREPGPSAMSLYVEAQLSSPVPRNGA
jgi:hypothetical protein